jgi:hypothetical protein
MDEVMARAYRAYFATVKREGLPSPDQPEVSSSGLQIEGGRQYVVLRNINRILAVYRVRRDGMLKRLRRWPKALEEY